MTGLEQYSSMGFGHGQVEFGGDGLGVAILVGLCQEENSLVVMGLEEESMVMKFGGLSA